MVKHQNTKHQTPNKLQALNKTAHGNRLVLEDWCFSGAWCLAFGVSLELGVWRLVFLPIMA
jgi:hypothetical protein